MRTRLVRGHVVTAITEEGDINLQRLNPEAAWWQRIENALGIVGAVITADARVIPPYHEMSTSEVLTKDRMQQGFSWTRVAHFNWASRLKDRLRGKILLDQDVDSFDSNSRWYIARLQVAENLVDQQSIANFDGDFSQVFMAAVHGISCLKSGDFGPAEFFKNRAGFFRAQIEPLVGVRVVAF